MFQVSLIINNKRLFWILGLNMYSYDKFIDVKLYFRFNIGIFFSSLQPKTV